MDITRQTPLNFSGQRPAEAWGITAGFIFEPLHSGSKDIIESARRTVDLLAAVGGRCLVTIDHVSGRAPDASGLAGSRRD